jgi:hypothetical protein
VEQPAPALYHPRRQLSTPPAFIRTVGTLSPLSPLYSLTIPMHARYRRQALSTLFLVFLVDGAPDLLRLAERE